MYGDPVKPKKQRAFIFQGEGVLSAYEGGVFKAFFEKIEDLNHEAGYPNAPIFDVILGTSMGAVNAAFVVNYVKRHKKWEDLPKELYRFWDRISEKSFI